MVEKTLTEHTGVHYIPVAGTQENMSWASTLLLLKENPRCAWDPAVCRICPSPNNTPVSHWQTSWQTFQSKFRRWALPLAWRWNQWAPQGESSLILTTVYFLKHAKTWVQAGCESWIRPVRDLLTQENWELRSWFGSLGWVKRSENLHGDVRCERQGWKSPANSRGNEIGK